MLCTTKQPCHKPVKTSRDGLKERRALKIDGWELMQAEAAAREALHEEQLRKLMEGMNDMLLRCDPRSPFSPLKVLLPPRVPPAQFLQGFLQGPNPVRPSLNLKTLCVS
jgi:hypothetical protein